MFTGIVEEPRPVRDVRARADGGLDVELDLGALAGGVKLGDSIACAGVCLTVAKLDGSVARFELSPETLARTHFAAMKAGDRVNVERALRLGDRLGGHLVQGHVDGVGRLTRFALSGEWAELDVELPPELSKSCVEKGSIALEGVSLTIARLRGSTVTIALVPHTLDRTTLGEQRAGDPVHVEVDLMAKYVERLVAPYLPRPSGAA